MNIEVSKDRWSQAQTSELATWQYAPPNVTDDWNSWWYSQFENYECLKKFPIQSILEVGCGPYARNMQFVNQVLGNTTQRLGLNDPLLDEYIRLDKPVAQYIRNNNVVTYNSSLEDLQVDDKHITYDCVICINVLSHVYNVAKCMDNMYNILNPNGILIFGEDLTKEDVDAVSAPEILTDTGHPIRFDAEYIKPFLKKYTPIFDKVLPREMGRNPRAHYCTVLFAGQKHEII